MLAIFKSSPSFIFIAFFNYLQPLLVTYRHRHMYIPAGMTSKDQPEELPVSRSRSSSDPSSRTPDFSDVDDPEPTKELYTT